MLRIPFTFVLMLLLSSSLFAAPPPMKLPPRKPSSPAFLLLAKNTKKNSVCTKEFELRLSSFLKKRKYVPHQKRGVRNFVHLPRQQGRVAVGSLQRHPKKGRGKKGVLPREKREKRQRRRRWAQETLFRPTPRSYYALALAMGGGVIALPYIYGSHGLEVLSFQEEASKKIRRDPLSYREREWLRDYGAMFPPL